MCAVTPIMEELLLKFGTKKKILSKALTHAFLIVKIFGLNFGVRRLWANQENGKLTDAPTAAGLIW